MKRPLMQSTIAFLLSYGILGPYATSGAPPSQGPGAVAGDAAAEAPARSEPRVDFSPPRPTPPATPGPQRARTLLPPRTVAELVEDALQPMTALMRARRIHIVVRHDCSWRVRQYATLRRALLVFLADTIQTTAQGAVVSIRCRDLAGSRAEIVIEDESASPSILERALASSDRSGRAMTLRDAVRDLEREHAARLHADAGDGKRLFLMDVGFPLEE